VTAPAPGRQVQAEVVVEGKHGGHRDHRFAPQSRKSAALWDAQAAWTAFCHTPRTAVGQRGALGGVSSHSAPEPAGCGTNRRTTRAVDDLLGGEAAAGRRRSCCASPYFKKIVSTRAGSLSVVARRGGPDSERSRSRLILTSLASAGLSAIVEQVSRLGHTGTAMTRAPALQAPGPRVTGLLHHLPTGSSACRIRTDRELQRVAVRGSHKRDRRPPHVRWKLRCPPPEPELSPDGGRSNGAEPSLSSASIT
jgi:hypothetical protein